jgi:hypothetical protein
LIKLIIVVFRLILKYGRSEKGINVAAESGRVVIDSRQNQEYLYFGAC